MTPNPKRSTMRKPALFVMVLCLLALAAPALADSIQPLDVSFSRITDNSPEGAQVNLNLNISQVDTNTLLFQFSNLSAIESVISEIYFQDTQGLVANYEILNDLNAGTVLFEEGANPANLPGGQDYSFTTSFATEADNPSPKWGVSPNETLNIYLTLNQGVAVATLVDSLNSQGFRIGAHVISIAGGESDSFLSGGGGGAAAPEPGTMALMASGLIGGWLVRRRRGKKKAA